MDKQMINPMSEQEFRKYFNRGITQDSMLRAQLDFRAHKLRTDYILGKVSEILNQKGINTLQIPSHNHFFKVAREAEIQRVYFGKNE